MKRGGQGGSPHAPATPLGFPPPPIKGAPLLTCLTPPCGCKYNIAGELENMGVSVMLAGNMGQGALNVLTAHNIKVIRGCSGNILDIAIDYLNGKLTDSGVGCSSHAHHHECHGHNHKE